AWVGVKLFHGCGNLSIRTRCRRLTHARALNRWNGTVYLVGDLLLCQPISGGISKDALADCGPEHAWTIISRSNLIVGRAVFAKHRDCLITEFRFHLRGVFDCRLIGIVLGLDPRNIALLRDGLLLLRGLLGSLI